MRLFEGKASRKTLSAIVLTVLLASLTYAQQAPTQIPGVKVDVISTTPLPGLDLPLNEIAAPVQGARAEDIQKSGALDLGDFLNRRLTNVYVNEIQSNPFQLDVNYRGYTASPLLGTPQGISVYMDGVRQNQPFGDVVSWDLIPRIAIDSITLMPGSNPLFGLNTLGGSLSLQTKTGKTQSGGSLGASYGSHVQRAMDFEYGRSYASGWHWYAAGNRLGENGWRADSHSDIRQAFGEFGRSDAMNSFRLSGGWAHNSMNGNALQEQRMLQRDYQSIYTRPDNTKNSTWFLNLEGRRTINSRLLLTGNIYYRDLGAKTLNADINEDSLDQALYQPNAAERAALAAAGYTGFPLSGESAANTPFPFWRCIANVLLQDEPGEKCNGLINRSELDQHNFGLSGQATYFGSVRGNRNQFTAGGAYDYSTDDFAQTTQLGYLNPDRSITGLEAFADGETGGDVDGEPLDLRVDLDGRPQTWSLYGTDALTVGSWHFTASARFNRTSVRNRDQIKPGGGPGSLDGDHVFMRLNPAAGVTYSPTELMNIYFSFSESSRAPTSIELGCADPDQPCKLPNAFAGDPRLEQVVARTWETGVRNGTRGPLTWNLGFFLADNYNDILFVTSEQSGFGYFKNFGRTKRQGIEASMMGTLWKKLTLRGGYTFLDTTYQSEEIVNGSGNSTNNIGSGLEGVIELEPGDRIPLTPRHMLKASLDYQPIQRVFFNLNLITAGSSFARGNENNLHQPQEPYYLGPGTVAGYGLVNAGVRVDVHKHLEVTAELDNVFNKRYSTAAQLGSTGFTADANFIARPFPAVGGEFPVQQATFYGPGAPRAFTVGTRLRF